ncbi:MAG: FAD-binding oxidoreductase [Chloroflexi bacterium]|nr:FAD-binding oxidoreductase [Chloroflexota bacterium]
MPVPGPNTSDVIVIGGGIAGCSAAYFLVKDGHSVTLIEKDAVAAHASGFAFGVLLPRLFDDPADPAAELTRHSMELHMEIAADLAESGERVRREKAAVLLADDERTAGQYRALYRSGAAAGDVRWLEYGELSHVEARVSPVVRGGLYLGGAAEIDPHRFTNALWSVAERQGARLVNAEVTSIAADGKHGVTVNTGTESYHAASVIVAAGPWTGKLLARHGATVPVEPLKGQIVRLKAPGPELRVSLWWGGGDYASSKPDGLLWCGTTEEPVGFNEQPDDAARDGIISSASRVMPFLEAATVARQTACLRPVSADGLPIIGALDGDGRVVVATGGGRNGIVLGPGLGRAAADIASGREPAFDVSRLAPSRFSA